MVHKNVGLGMLGGEQINFLIMEIVNHSRKMFFYKEHISKQFSKYTLFDAYKQSTVYVLGMFGHIVIQIYLGGGKLIVVSCNIMKNG